MQLPPSFAQAGIVNPALARKKFKLRNGRFLKPLMIGTDGKTNTGKTEFILSCPDPGAGLFIDRGFSGVFDNPNPPEARRDGWGIKIIQIPPNLTATQPTYKEYFNQCRDAFYSMLSNPDAVTVAVDCDSDFWELQRLCDFGKLANVWPQTKYGDTYAAKRAITAKAWDSGKIIVGTNKVRDEYETVYNADGTPQKESDGSEKKVKTGRDVRQGFPDQDYLWDIQLRHMYQEPRLNTVTKKTMPGKWGIKITKCKARPELKGDELWGEDCNFLGLVSLVYPNVPLEEWGL